MRDKIVFLLSISSILNQICVLSVDDNRFGYCLLVLSTRNNEKIVSVDIVAAVYRILIWKVSELRMNTLTYNSSTQIDNNLRCNN